MTRLRLPQEKAMRQQQMTRLIHSLPQLTHHQRQQLASCLQALLDHSPPNLSALLQPAACQEWLGQRAATLQVPPVRAHLQRLDWNTAGTPASAG